MPCGVKLSDVDDYQKDVSNLLHRCQVHRCSSYCLRVCSKKRKRGSENLQRACKFGAGVEITPNNCNTSGFDLRKEPVLSRERKYFTTLLLDRNHPLLYQTSTVLLQGWRGNCDWKLLTYDSIDNIISPEEVNRVTEYVASYACKGNMTHIQEQEINRDLILSEKSIFANMTDVVRVARKILNSSHSSRMISKQECMVELAGLPLVFCSELITSIGLSGVYRLTQKGSNYGGSVLHKYIRRKDSQRHLSLYDFFKSENRVPYKGKMKIPHFTGGNSQPTYPVTKEYARMTLMVHRPWAGTDPGRYESNTDIIEEFTTYLQSAECPTIVRLQYERAKDIYQRKLSERVQDDEGEIVDGTTNVDQDVLDAVQLSSTNAINIPTDDDYNFPLGVDYDWGQRHTTVRRKQFH